MRFRNRLCNRPRTSPGVSKPLMAQLEGEKTQQTLTTLARVWKLSEPDRYPQRKSCPKSGFLKKEEPKSNRSSGYHSSIGMPSISSRVTLTKKLRSNNIA